MFKDNKKLIFIILFLLCFNASFAEEVSAPLEISQHDTPFLSGFTKDDRVLILSPHPDDETIGTAGIIQRAVKAGSKVRVVCFTNGDNNELAFIVYEKRITFRKKEFLHMGTVRAKETIKAMDALGLKKEDIIFMGYPDFGTLTILTKYWGNTRPYRSFFARVSQVSYPDAFSPGALFVGENILRDLKKILLDFKPTKIFVSHPSDTNRDHQSLYLFTKVALWDLAEELKGYDIFPGIIHVVGWPKPRGHHLELKLDPPLRLKGVFWQRFFLSEEEETIKHKAINYFTSQIECNPPYLFSFARKNELFGDYPEIKLKRQDAQKQLVWRYLDVDTDVEEYSVLSEVEDNKDFISTLAYACQDSSLFIKLNLKKRIATSAGVSVFLLGYNKNKHFADMPKIQINLGILGKRIRDKRKVILVKDFKMYHEGSSLVLKIPLLALGDPQYILTKVKTRSANFPSYAWSWRTIELE